MTEGSAGFGLPNFSIDLSGQVALVTGASSGLGRRFATVLAACGAKVAAAARREERLKSWPPRSAAAGGDVRPGAARRHRRRPDRPPPSTAPRPSWAGVDPRQQRRHPRRAVRHEDVRRAGRRGLDTNLRGPFLLSCEVARRLIERQVRQAGSSTSRRWAPTTTRAPGAALYSITKAAVDRMTETLAVEWARFGINVNAIAPGAFAPR